MTKGTSEKRTLLLSILMSAPGPLIVGIGFVMGKSSTQLSDLIRRSAELVGLIVAYITYIITAGNNSCDSSQKLRIECTSNIIVGSMMLLAGSIMLFFSFKDTGHETGNVIPGLAVSVLGVIANTLFWIKYNRLNSSEPNPIIAVQSRLYRAKSLVDICVTTALISLLLMPGTVVSSLLDTVGSAIVAAYLSFCGIRTISDAVKRMLSRHD